MTDGLCRCGHPVNNHVLQVAPTWKNDYTRLEGCGPCQGDVFYLTDCACMTPKPLYGDIVAIEPARPNYPEYDGDFRA